MTPAAGRHLIDGYRSPFRTSWLLWARSLPVLAAHTAPLAAAMGLLTEWVETDANGGVSGGWVFVAAIVFLAIYAIALIQTVVTWRHTGDRHGNILLFVLVGMPGWLATYVLVLIATSLGTLLLLIPGIYLALRLFWADEFALLHRANPIAALRQSWDLTKGQAWPIYTFQFLTGLVGTVVLLVGVLLVVPVASWMERFPGIGQAVGNAFIYWMVMMTYAAIHASEVAYFYGMRAAKR